MPLLARVLITLSLFTVILAPGVRAQTAEPPQPPKSFDLKAIDDYVARQVKDKGFVGLSLAILRDGKVVLAKGYGKSSLQPDVPVSPDTLFAVGSITKQFTCACILLLAEEGKLSVQDRVAKYYPDLTRAKDITLLDLMTHVSGYPDYYPLDFVDRRMQKAIPLDDLLREYAGGKLDFEPGTRWSYSNTGYILLGQVVEKVAGEPFDKFLDRRILKPLGMEHSAFEPAEGHKRLARGHTSFALGEPEPARREAGGWIHAAGGLYASASDLLKWDLALMDGKVLEPESFKLMTTPRKLANGKVRNYGWGVGVAQRNGETVLQHSGAVSGFLAYNAMLPRTRSAVVLLTNGDYVDAGALHGEILGLLLKEQDAEIPRVQGPPPKDAALELLRQMQAGVINRDKLGADFNDYLRDDRVKAAAARLEALGEPTKVEVESVSERGGMEVAVIRFTFKTAAVKAYLYRTPDGKIQEFLLYRA
jgi:CubicO group peptidase (beta-lactamase class C family)